MKRLRDEAPDYTEPYDHTGWHDHRDRIKRTQELAQIIDPMSAADLAAGDGAVLDSLRQTIPKVYGDLVERPGWHVGPIDVTVRRISPVDLFVCTEALEHLDDPAEVLSLIRAKAQRLLLSTPVENWDDFNAEHLWAWSQKDVSDLLAAAEWRVTFYTEWDYRNIGGYLTGVWVAV